MDRGRLDKWCERGILLVVVACLVVGPLALGGVRPREFAWLQGLLAVGIVLWVARPWLNPGLPAAMATGLLVRGGVHGLCGRPVLPVGCRVRGPA